jgi:hypothetical protein
VTDDDLRRMRAEWTTPPEFARMIAEADRVVTF